MLKNKYKKLIAALLSSAMLFSYTAVFADDTADSASDIGFDGKVVISKNMTSIPSNFMWGASSYTSLVIPEGVLSIKSYAFYTSSQNCTLFYFPKSLVSISSECFSGDNDTDYSSNVIMYSGTDEDWDNITIGSYNRRIKQATIYYCDITAASIKSIASQYYTGSAITPDVIVTLGSRVLTEDTDYTVSYSNNINVGTATVTVTGIGSFSGTLSKTFSIVRSYISGATVSSIADQAYTGSTIMPTPTITFNGKTLTKGTDYTLMYDDNVNPGTAVITITGTGNFRGTKTVTFTISGKNISSATISSISSQTYTGSEITPKPTVTYSGTTLTIDKDYTLSYSNNINVGTATVTVTGIGDYSGTATATFTISARAISAATVSGVDSTYAYSYISVCPEPTVKYGDTTLVKGTDYTLSYSNNIEPGIATITITGIGNFTGTATKTFTITEVDFEIYYNGDISYAYGHEPDVSASNLTVKVYNADSTVTTYTGSDIGTISVTYENDTNYGAGSHVYFYVIGNYNSDLSFLYTDIAAVLGVYETTISPIYLGNDSIIDFTYYEFKEGNLTFNTQRIDGVSYYAELPSRTYTGEAIEFTAVDMVDWDYRSILNSLDVSYKDNINAGTGYMTFSGDGSNIIGSMTFPFTIDPADISTDVTISSIENQVYKGEALTPAITATYNGMTLVEGTDYTVEYSNNNAVGTGKATITGIGNYTGTVTKTFTIKEWDPEDESISIADVSISLNADSYTYTGSEIVPSLEVTYKVSENYTYTLVEGEDYTITCTNNIDVGTATYTITGIEQGDGGFTGTTEAAYFYITAAQITSADTYAYLDDVYYTGEEITQSDKIELVFNSTTLIEDEDYVLIYSDNTNAGTATITVRGIGNFTGSDYMTFTILSTELTDSNVTVSDIEDVTYNKSAQEPEPDVYLDGVLLTKDVDYTLSYENNTNAGTATVIITGIDNCTGEIRKNFTIKPKSGNMFIIILLDDWQ